MKELSKTIEAWIRNHNGERPPASRIFRKHDIKEHVIKDVQLTVGSGSGWVRRFQINDQWMAWLIEDKKGGCMLAKPAMKFSGSGFQAWLGGDLGFTPAPYAHVVKPANRPMILDSELIDSEDDGSEVDDANTGRSSRIGSCSDRFRELKIFQPARRNYKAYPESRELGYPSTIQCLTYCHHLLDRRTTYISNHMLPSAARPSGVPVQLPHLLQALCHYQHGHQPHVLLMP